MTDLIDSDIQAAEAEPQGAWHALGAAEALGRLRADRHGLSDAAIRERRARFGPNALPEPPRRSALARLAAQFNNLRSMC